MENTRHELNLDEVIISTQDINLTKALVSDLEHVIVIEDQYLNQDTELLNYFIEEIKELTYKIRDHIVHLKSSASHLEIHLELKRIFHTLKGSGRMVGLNSASELSWIAEKLLNDCIEQQDLSTDKVIKFVIVIYQIYVQKIIPAIQAEKLLDLDLRPYILLGGQLLEKKDLDQELLFFLNLHQFFNLELQCSDTPIELNLQYKLESTEKIDIQQNDLISSQPLAHESLNDKQKRSLKIDESAIISKFDLNEFKQAIDDDLALNLVDTTQPYLDEEIKEFFVEEATELLELINVEFQKWKIHQAEIKILQKIMRYLHTLKGGAYMLRADYFGYLTHELESLYQFIIDQQGGAENSQLHYIDAIELIQRNLTHRIAIINNERIDYPILNSQKVLQRLLNTSTQNIDINSYPKQNPNLSLRSVEQSFDPIADCSNVNVDESEIALGFKSSIIERVANIESEAFKELISDCLNLMDQMTGDSQLHAKALHLKYYVHRVRKAIDRTCSQSNQNNPQISALIEHIENAFEQALIEPTNFFAQKDLLKAGLQEIEKIVFGSRQSCDESILQKIEQISYQYAANLNAKNYGLREDKAALRPNFLLGDQQLPPSMWGNLEPVKYKTLHAGQIRVSTEHLDKINELVVEQVSHQTQIEINLQDYANTLTDMGLVIHNLIDQIKRIDGELTPKMIESQSLRSQSAEHFDLLEMDQYSELNQFSKSLNESASDLLELKSNLMTQLKSAEVVLSRQSRIQAELQHEITNIYRVPFNQLKNRLERLVNQTAQMLNKQVQLVLNGAEIEVESSLLDRLIVPLEHMLRNAIDHGIESDEERLKLNKAIKSQIKIELTQNHNELLIQLTDDGRGLDFQHIRQKAIEARLIHSEQQYSEQEIFQLIFHSGLSTAEIISPMSGRGVGLDVVQSEIKALGGKVFVQSILNQGCKFEIRLPIIKAALDVFIVQVQLQQYALPLGHVERVVRLSPQQLAACEQKNKSCLEIDDVSYKLRYLANVVGLESNNRHWKDDVNKVAFLFKSSAGENTALLVDDLIGTNTQIVVKPLVPLMAKLDLFIGATILKNGHVCLILDDQKLLQRLQYDEKAQLQNDQKSLLPATQQKLICVVDDSVTVRKVTSQFLERHQYSVMTAKDGEDAIEQLAQQIPDLILLDVEMPRKDGFEVIQWIKAQASLQSIPIIMISSRVGEKHRRYALELGASAYMGKPYQEQELLETMHQLIHPNLMEQGSTNVKH